jgi:hypothetical protein
VITTDGTDVPDALQWVLSTIAEQRGADEPAKQEIIICAICGFLIILYYY